MVGKLASRMMGVLAAAMLCLCAAVPMALAEDLVDISGATVTAADATYTGSALEPAVTVKVGEATLKAGTDFDVAYASNTKAGTAKVSVTGKGAYTGQAAGTFTIKPASAKGLSIVKPDPVVYNGKARTPSPVVMFGDVKLKKGRDYTLSYESNTNAGKAKVIVTGQGNFTGQKSAKFTIQKALASKMKVAKISKKTYTGKAITPSPKVTFKGKKLKKGRDYTIIYKANKNVGKAKVVIKGMGNFKGKNRVYFTIRKASASKFAVAKIPSKVYTGSSIKPSPKVTFNGKKLKKGRDYTLSYGSNKNAGIAKVYVKGKGNFTGKKTAEFTIKTVSIDKATIKPINDKAYTGDLVRPNPKITYKGKRLKLGTDYELSFDNNNKVGKAKVTINAKGNFTGARSATFNIVPRSIANSKTEVGAMQPKPYTGNPIEPRPVVRVKGHKLVRDVDYTLSYANNIAIGTGTVYVTGKGNYTGTVSAEFQIVAG
ncbi:MAG: hypothetical protein Q4D27_06525 [Coriobacteriia bacterium]|nr:hypothetical protein [Coriobacteriia bacterium]